MVANARAIIALFNRSYRSIGPMARRSSHRGHAGKIILAMPLDVAARFRPRLVP
jgi:hypothetical protein